MSDEKYVGAVAAAKQAALIKAYVDSKVKKDFVVNITFDSTSAPSIIDDANLAVFTASADKTFSEISAAVAAGKNVYGMWNGHKWPLYLASSTSFAFRGHIQLANLFGTVGLAIAICSIWQDGCNVEVSAGELPVPALDGSDDGKCIAVSGSKWEMKKSVVDVDDALSDTSTNPVQNKVVKAALDGKASTAVASQTANGLMSKDDKKKLDGVAEGANKTTVIDALDPLSHNPVSSAALFEALSNKADRKEATEQAAGLMSAFDKKKLNGIEDGANKTIVDEMLSDGSTNPVQNKAVTAALASVVRETIYPIAVTATSTEWVVNNGIAYKEASADRTFDDIKAASIGNKTPVCEFEGMTYSLILDSSTAFIFASYRGAVANDSQYAGLGKYPTSLITINTTGVVISRTAGDLPAVGGTDNGKMLIVAGGEWALQRVPGATVDAELSTTSENPVQNKTVTAALNGKLPKTGGTVTGALRTNDSFSAGGTIAFGEAPIVLSQTDDGAAKIRYGNADVNDNPPPLSRLKVARPTADDDAATKAYVDGRAAGTGAVRYDAAQTLEAAQQFQARQNINAAGVVMPQFQGFLSLAPANAPLGTGVGLSPSGSGNDFTLDISDVNENTPTLLTGVKTPTDADTNAAATVEYVNAKVASGGVTVDDAMSDTSTNPVQNKVIKKYVDDSVAEAGSSAGAVRYDVMQSLTVKDKQRACSNIDAAEREWPTFTGSVSLCPEQITDSDDAVHVTTEKASSDDFTVTLDCGLQNAPVRVKGIRTPTDSDTNAAANVEYVNAKVASGGVTVDAALSATSTNPVQNKAVKTALDRKAGTAVATASANGLMSKDDKSKLDGITGQVTAANIHAPEHTTDLVQYGAFQIAAQQIISQIPTVPDVLPNPKALTIKIGSTTVTYDGSTAQTVTIADGSEVSY